MFNPKRVISTPLAIFFVIILSSCGTPTETNTLNNRNLQESVSGVNSYDETDNKTNFPTLNNDPESLYLLSKIVEYDSSNKPGRTMSFEYDELGRLISVYSPGTLTLFYYYDEQGHIEKVEYYDRVREEVVSRHEYKHNERGLLTTRTYYVKNGYELTESPSSGNTVKRVSGTTTKYEYDASNGNLIRRITSSSENPELEVVEYTYDGNILLSKTITIAETLVDWMGNEGEDVNYISEYDEYDCSLGITKKTYYNREGEIRLYQEWYDTDTMPVAVEEYIDDIYVDGFNEILNLKLKEERAKRGGIPDQSVYSEVEYNSDGRLAAATTTFSQKYDAQIETQTITKTRKFEYDEAGNLIKIEIFDDQGFSLGSVVYEYILKG